MAKRYNFTEEELEDYLKRKTDFTKLCLLQEIHRRLKPYFCDETNNEEANEFIDNVLSNIHKEHKLG